MSDKPKLCEKCEWQPASRMFGTRDVCQDCYDIMDRIDFDDLPRQSDSIPDSHIVGTLRNANGRSQLADAERQRKAKSKKKNKNTEAQIQKAILEYLGYRSDVHAWRTNSGKVQTNHGRWIQMAPKGTSDIIGTWNGRILAIETKKPKPSKTYATKEQKAFIQLINDLGGLAFVARSVDDVIAMMPYDIDNDSVQLEGA